MMLSFEVTVLDSNTQKCSSYTGSIDPDFYHCLHSYMIQIVVDVVLFVGHLFAQRDVHPTVVEWLLRRATRWHNPRPPYSITHSCQPVCAYRFV